MVKLNITDALNMTEVLNAYKKKRRTVYVEENWSFIYIYIKEEIQLDLKLEPNFILCVPFNFLNFGAIIYYTTKIKQSNLFIF